MIFLIVLGLLQALILPGLCLLIYANRRSILVLSSCETLILSVIFSACINHFLILILYIFGIYSQSFLLGIIIIELVYIWKMLVSIEHLKCHYIRCLRLTERLISNPAANWATFIYFLYPLLYFVLYKQYIFQVFSGWDAVVSWNRWGVELYDGKFQSSWGYPLGLPVLLSIVYKAALETNIQLFSKFICWIWPLAGGSLLLICSNQFKKYRAEFILSAFIFPYLMEKGFNEDFIFAGFVDPIVAVYSIFFIYATAYLLQNQAILGGLFNSRLYFLLGFGVVGGVFFKITAFWYLGIYSLVGAYIVIRGNGNVIRYLVITSIVSILGLSWYLWVLITTNDFPISTYKSLGVGNILIRPINYGLTFWKVFGIIPTIFFILGLIFSHYSKLIFLTTVVPLFILCSIIAGYDMRASFVLYGPISFICASGVCAAIRLIYLIVSVALNSIYKLYDVISRSYLILAKYILRIFLIVSLVAILTFTLVLSNYLSKEKILNINTNLRVKTNDFGFNQRILQILNNESDALIFSCWQLPYGLPGAPGRFFASGDCSIAMVEQWINSPHIKYLLYWYNPDPNSVTPKVEDVRNLLRDRVKDLQEEGLVKNYILFSR
jgi:hypothetical protein